VVAASLNAAPAALSLVAQTPHFTVYSRSEKVNAHQLEKHLRDVEKTLGRRFTKRATYYRYDHAAEIKAVTGSYAAGITYLDSNEVHSLDRAVLHEIVHLVANTLGRPGAFVKEGLAVALSSKGKWAEGSLRDAAKARVRVQPDVLRRASQCFRDLDPEVAYPVAGSFVEWLIETYGLPRVLRFYEASRDGVDEAAFRQAFGTDFDQAENAWRLAL
jgi:hypothetical protein